MYVSLWKRAALCLACFGMIVPQGALVAAEKNGQQTVHMLDVKMADGNTLAGQVVDAQGKVLKNTTVAVRFHNQVIATTKTNDAGRYAFKGLRSGAHQIETVNGRVNARFWNAKTAPPKAKSFALIVSDKNVIRAQCGEAGCGIGGVGNGGLFGHGGGVVGNGGGMIGDGGWGNGGWVNGNAYGVDGGYGFGDGGYYGDAYCGDYGYGGGVAYGGGGGGLFGGGGGGLFGGGLLTTGLVTAGIVTAIAVAANDDNDRRRSSP